MEDIINSDYIQAKDGVKLYWQDWHLQEPKAVILLVHGLGEHCGRYDHVARFWARQSVAMVGYDHRGHGKSGGKRGYIPSMGQLWEDLTTILEKTRVLYPDKPVFLYGHSMGGNIVLNYVLKIKPAIKGVIVTGPYIRLAFQPSPLIVILGKAMRIVYPGFTQNNQLNVNFISRDQKVVENYKNDPLVHDRLTAILGTSLLETAAFLDSFEGNFESPLLLMHGAEDKITSPKGTANFTRRVKGHISHKEWPELYHEIHNEPEREMVFNYMALWLNEQLIRTTNDNRMTIE